jgi:hypothetical protein
MKVECTLCDKVYNFKKEKLPAYGFSFPCKSCGEKIKVSQADIDAFLAGAKKDTAKKKIKVALPKVETEKLKKTMAKAGDKAGDIVSGLAARSERDWAVSVTKTVAYFCIGLLVLLAVFGGFIYYSLGVNKNVTYAEVARSLELKLDPVITIQKAVPDIKLPNGVKRYFGEDHRETFVEWMNGLDNYQKKNFIKNLDKIIRLAQRDAPNHVHDYALEYGKLKLKYSVNENLVKYLLKFGLIMALILMVALLGMFSLILLKLTPRKTGAKAAKSKSVAKSRGRRSSPKKASASKRRNS